MSGDDVQSTDVVLNACACGHSVWWHERQGCGYLGFNKAQRCPCPLMAHEAVETLVAAARADEREHMVTAVKVEREGFLHSDTLDPAWIAGWHAAVDWAAFRLGQRDLPPAATEEADRG